MNPRTPSLTKIVGVLLALILGCSSPVAWSQESPKADEPAPAKTKAKTADKPKPAQRNTAADTIDTTSPFDYRASEEISQDRSVSFPVDI